MDALEFRIPALIIGSIVKVCPAFITLTALVPALRKQIHMTIAKQKDCQ